MTIKLTLTGIRPVHPSLGHKAKPELTTLPQRPESVAEGNPLESKTINAWFDTAQKATEKVNRPVAKPGTSAPIKLNLSMPKATEKPIVPTTLLATEEPKTIAANPLSISIKTKPTLPVPADLAYRGINTYDALGNPIQLDKSQCTAVDLAIEGKTFCLVGAAGTGKTTTNQAIMIALNKYHKDRITEISYRLVNSGGQRAYASSVAVVAFSNKATNNMKAKLQSHPDLVELVGANVTTIHNLLEYTVEIQYNELLEKNVRVSYPKRDKNNKLEITHLIVEEASMVGAGASTLWEKVVDALPPHVQIIYLGDINQIQPVGGKPVLAYAMQKLYTNELDTIHRQALDNPIIAQAYNCLRGKPIVTQLVNEDKGVLVLSGKSKNGNLKKFSVSHMVDAITRKVPQLIESGIYDVDSDIWLCPFNKSSRMENQQDPTKALIGTIDINAIIAGYLAKKHNRLVYEINTGFQSLYLSVGDRVFIDKKEGIITEIKPNPKYVGRTPKPASSNMDYYGHVTGAHSHSFESKINTDFNYDGYSARLEEASVEEAEEKSRSASHIVKARMDDEYDATLAGSGDFGANVFNLGYALSVHKAQGSEWRKAFVVLHDCHAVMLYREMLYTAMTRPKEALVLFAQPHVLAKATATQRIKGTTLASKIEYFNGGYLDQKVTVDMTDAANDTDIVIEED